MSARLASGEETLNVAVEELTNILLNSADSRDYLFVRSCWRKSISDDAAESCRDTVIASTVSKGSFHFPPPPVIHSFPAASGPFAAEHAHLRYPQIFSLMQKKDFFFSLTLIFFPFFSKHSFQLSTKWWSVFTTEESWCTAPWLTNLKDAGSPPSITSAVVPCTVQPACRVSTSPPPSSSSMSASAISPASSWATWTEACWCGPTRRASSSNDCARAESSGWGWRRWGLSAAPCPANWRGTLLWRSLTRNGFSKVRLCVQLAMLRFLQLQLFFCVLQLCSCTRRARFPPQIQ